MTTEANGPAPTEDDEDDEDDEVCDICGFESNSPWEMDMHLELHDEND